MAAVGTVTVKVQPDLSAFRTADVADITDVLEKYLLPHLPRNRGRGDLRVVAQALANRFTIIPKGTVA